MTNQSIQKLITKSFLFPSKKGIEHGQLLIIIEKNLPTRSVFSNLQTNSELLALSHKWITPCLFTHTLPDFSFACFQVYK